MDPRRVAAIRQAAEPWSGAGVAGVAGCTVLGPRRCRAPGPPQPRPDSPRLRQVSRSGYSRCCSKWGPCSDVSAAVCRAMGAAPWPGEHGWARCDPRPAHRRLDPAPPAQHTRGPARVAAPPARLSRPHVPPAEWWCHHGHPQARPWANGRCAGRVAVGVAALAPRTPVPLARTPPVLPRYRHRHLHRRRHRSECTVHGVVPALQDIGVAGGGRTGAGSGRMLQRASHGKTGESRGGYERWRWRAREWLAQCCCRPHPDPDPHPSRPPPVLSQ